MIQNILRFFQNSMIIVLVDFTTPPSPSSSFQIFQTGVSGLSSSGWFKGETTEGVYIGNKENQRKISDFQKVFRRGHMIWVRGG